MKKVRQISTGYIFLSALYVAVGILLLLTASYLSSTVIGRGFGILMLVLGVTYIIIYFTRERQEGFLQMDLIIGIICLAFGIFVLARPSFMETFLPFAMAIVLFLGAIVKIQNAVYMRQLHLARWYLLLCCAFVTIILGILLLLNILPEGTVLFLYIGCSLIFDGLSNLVSLLFIGLRTRKLKRLQQANPETDPGELLDRSKEAEKSRKAAKREKKEEDKKVVVTVDDAEVADVPEQPALTDDSGSSADDGKEQQ